MKRLLIVLPLFLLTCTDGGSPTAPDIFVPPAPISITYDVEYRVTGSNNVPSVSLTFENRNGGTSQRSNAPLPWSYTFTGRSGDFVYVSAQNNGQVGNITVTIFRNGSVFERSSSAGAFVIATASGSL